jgi:4-amino-4-deoxy-L-arabinose transferase-like glycosyltransferase
MVAGNRDVATSRTRWLLVAGFALAVRLAYWAIVTPSWKPQSDAWQYVDLARNLARGHGFASAFPQIFVHATAFRPPLYPSLLAPLMWLGGNALWPARLLNALIGTAVVILAGLYAQSIGGRRSGMVAACLVAVYPPLLANDTITLTEPLALALLLIALLAVDRRQWVLSGLACGLFMLTRPNGYLFVLLIVLFVATTLGWRRGLGCLAIVAAVVTPWLIRNDVQVGTSQLTTSDGFNVAAIYAPAAQAHGTFVDPVFAPEYSSLGERLTRLDEARWNKHLLSLGIHNAAAHPGYVWRTVSRNFRSYFEISPSLNTRAEALDGRRKLFRTLSLPLFYAVTIVGLVGLVRFRHDRRVLLLGLITAQFVVVSLLLVAPPRLRAPFDLACCIGVGLVAHQETGKESEPELVTTAA